MHLTDVINEDLILMDIDANKKEDVLKELALNLKEKDYIIDTQKFLEDVMYRESLGETGIGNYIAIPHGQSDSVRKSTITIGKLKKVIEWESLDDNGVKVVILFAVENDAEYAKKHLKLLAEVARKLADEKILENLLNSKTKNEVINCFI